MCYKNIHTVKICSVHSGIKVVETKHFPPLLLAVKVDQNIFFPETCFASTISEPEFTVWAGWVGWAIACNDSHIEKNLQTKSSDKIFKQDLQTRSSNKIFKQDLQINEMK